MGSKKAAMSARRKILACKKAGDSLIWYAGSMQPLGLDGERMAEESAVIAKGTGICIHTAPLDDLSNPLHGKLVWNVSHHPSGMKMAQFSTVIEATMFGTTVAVHRPMPERTPIITTELQAELSAWVHAASISDERMLVRALASMLSPGGMTMTVDFTPEEATALKSTPDVFKKRR